MKSYQLHLARDRRDLFAQLSPAVWCETGILRTWVVADPALVTRIMRHPSTVISDLAEAVRTVRTKFAIELPNIDFACSVLPVLVSDDVHPDIRRGFATFLSGRLVELNAELPGMVGASLAPLARRGQVDIMASVIRPLMRRLFSIFLKADMPEDFLSLHVIEILSFKAMVGHLKSLDARIGRALSFLRATSADEREVGWKFICLVFGLDSVTMMLAEGIVAALREFESGRTDAVKLPDFPVETGVPVSHRRAKSDFEIDGHKFAAGDWIRLQMQSLGYSPAPDDRKFIFGAGAHSCLGKQVSLRIWDAFRQEFDSLNLRARLIDYSIFPSHYIIYHDSIQLEVF
ncbi:hypothetical protein [Taklimakanibacter lacteus]|uniref:hypothetical protein n=1 Tax=Taklimakanibacter lacteus TaxID=2268456 RepID=UPI000E671A3D